MKRIIIITGLMFCATTVFAQSCVTRKEKDMYERYNDVFDKIDFSAPHWQGAATTKEVLDKRMEDLVVLAFKLAYKFGIAHVFKGNNIIDFLKDKEGNIIEYENHTLGMYRRYPRQLEGYSHQIQINKAYLKKGDISKDGKTTQVISDVMIETVAEEVCHVHQINEIAKIEEYKKEREMIKHQKQKEGNGSENNNLKRDLKIYALEVKINTLDQWIEDLRNSVHKDMAEYDDFIKNKKLLEEFEATGQHRKNIALYFRLQSATQGKFNNLDSVNRMLATHNNLDFEKVGEEYGKIIVKVYKDKQQEKIAAKKTKTN